jgi:DNA-binding NtrC family response regulator
MKILVLDDDERLMRTMVRRLRRAGHDVEGFTAVGDAFRVLEQGGGVDLFISDFDLSDPGWNGVLVIQRVVKEDLAQYTILQSSSTFQTIVEYCRKKDISCDGIKNFFLKPEQIDLLFRLIGTISESDAPKAK